MPPSHRPLRGIALLLVALLAFASYDATAKFLSTRYSLPMLVWVRYALPCVVLAAWFAPRKGGALVATGHPLLQIVRALLLLACTASGMAAVRTVPLAEATAILFAAPLLVTLAAGPLLGERVPRMAWFAVVLGFCGVVVIARPGAGVDPVGGGLMLVAAVSFAGYQLLTRRLAATDASLVTLFYTALVGAVVMTVGLPLFWTPLAPTPLHALMIVSLGVWGMIGHYLLIRAFALAPASTLSPFLYFQLVWASLLGWLVFGDLPDWITAGGIGLIAAAGLGLAARQHARLRSDACAFRPLPGERPAHAAADRDTAC